VHGTRIHEHLELSVVELRRHREPGHPSIEFVHRGMASGTIDALAGVHATLQLNLEAFSGTVSLHTPRGRLRFDLVSWSTWGRTRASGGRVNPNRSTGAFARVAAHGNFKATFDRATWRLIIDVDAVLAPIPLEQRPAVRTIVTRTADGRIVCRHACVRP
jgi:hypothetical protein